MTQATGPEPQDGVLPATDAAGGKRPLLEQRIQELTAQLQALVHRVEALEAGRQAPLPAASVPAGQPASIDSEPVPVEATEQLFAWMGRSSLLARLATLCFLLVVALMVRTVTDYGLLEKPLGVVIGMVYSSLLMAMGWYRYRRISPMAPVYTACAAVLLFTIVVETHVRFEILSVRDAHALLAGTAIGMSIIAHRYTRGFLVLVGVLGLIVAAAVLNIPQPHYPYLGALLLIANVLAFFARRLPRCAWLCWVLLVLSIVVMQLWAHQLSSWGATAPGLYHNWFLPLIGLIGGVYAATAFAGTLNNARRPAVFDLAVPTINVVWVFLAVRQVVLAQQSAAFAVGGIGMAVALMHLGAAAWLGWRNPPSAPGANAFVVAGATLLALAVPVASGDLAASLLLLTALGFGLALLSRSWETGAVRVTSYALQSYVCIGVALLVGHYATPVSAPVAALVAAVCAAVALLHYRWCRTHAPPNNSFFFSRLDPSDRIAVVLLLAALNHGFFTVSIGIDEFIARLPVDHDNAFSGAQSVIINSSAAVLMLLAFARKNNEIRNVAVLVTLVGAVKVFLLDLLSTHGLPLVFSVLSFGLAAALQSFLLSRWRRPAPHPASATET